ncbi:SRPBCC family protein [Streptomyces sp. NBS 14/10]|uniref:SRPBCC family protein n=1 Tax=Streptomyces sp. NBS 14/10 TaxID=1945643 RepID=UPI000B7D9945|nr:SRPBCC family protein [Streptomyces sp. NBS 14/10]KAK1180438.1 SRPBCC family protein [Streptomyces sp. NBS 14/10]NUS81531.1 SRPBCC family protein [Streptomyces sp.]
MASIHKEFVVDATPDAVWDVLSDYGAVHKRLAPGFVTDTQLSSDTRTVTFSDGTIVHERLVDLDHGARRVAYTVVGGSLHPAHHHASMQALAEAGGRTRFVWHTDVLPDTLAAPIAEFVEQGSVVIRQALEGRIGMTTG